jgi:hypothetical protein
MPSVFSRLSSGDSPALGSGFVDLLGLRPSFPRATLITLAEQDQESPDASSGEAARCMLLEQAACSASYSYPSLSPISFIPKESPLEVIADRVSLFRSLHVDSPPPELSFASPERVYLNFATTPVSAALAVIRVQRTNLDQDPPMALAMIAYPSVLPFGYSQPVFDPNPPPLSRLQPGGMISPSDGGTYPLLGSFLHGNRITELGSVASSCSAFLEAAVVLWGAKAFSHVLHPGAHVRHGPWARVPLS